MSFAGFVFDMIRRDKENRNLRLLRRERLNERLDKIHKGCGKCPAGRMCRYNRYARAGAGIELRSLWLSYLCRAYGGCAMCLEYG